MPNRDFSPPCGFDIATTTFRGDPADITSWGYRLVTHPGGMWFVHEVYYDRHEGLLGFAQAPARPCGDTAEEVQEAVEGMAEAFDQPPLSYADFAHPPLAYGRYADDPFEPSSGDGAAGAPPS